MYGSNNSSIYSNTIENVNYAISIDSGNYNKIYNNSIAMCCDYGLDLMYSKHNKIMRNNIIKTSYGISLYESDYNVVYKKQHCTDLP